MNNVVVEIETPVLRLCERCETPISQARLRWVPHTRICVACKAMDDEPKVSANSMFVRGALVEMSACTGEQERAITRLAEGKAEMLRGRK